MNKPTVADYEKDTIEIIGELIQDWDTGFDGGISPSTAIVADLGFESLDVVYLITAIEQRFKKSDFPFEELLMVDGHYVDDLTASQIAQFLHKHLSDLGREAGEHA